MITREFLKSAAICVFNRVCPDESSRNIAICQTTVAAISLAGFGSAFAFFAITDNVLVSAFTATALTFGTFRPANRWMEWACDQPMP